eukprot:gene10772-biopygen7829
MRAVFADNDLRDVWGIACLALGQLGHLEVFDEEKSQVSLMSTAGIRLGMVWGPSLSPVGFTRCSIQLGTATQR